MLIIAYQFIVFHEHYLQILKFCQGNFLLYAFVLKGLALSSLVILKHKLWGVKIISQL